MTRPRRTPRVPTTWRDRQHASAGLCVPHQIARSGSTRAVLAPRLYRPAYSHETQGAQFSDAFLCVILLLCTVLMCVKCESVENSSLPLRLSASVYVRSSAVPLCVCDCVPVRLCGRSRRLAARCPLSAVPCAAPAATTTQHYSSRSSDMMFESPFSLPLARWDPG